MGQKVAEGLDTTDWGRSPENKNQHSETRKPRWLTCHADEFIHKWLPKFESGEMEYAEAKRGSKTGGD
jgi:hypothetical protein